MIFADKLIDLRKKNGWSQEELAEKLNVSRQAVSKWEGAQSIPDMSRMIQLSELFGVSTDYLLKDNLEQTELTQESAADSSSRTISMEEPVVPMMLERSVPTAMNRRLTRGEPARSSRKVMLPATQNRPSSIIIKER